MPEQMYVGSNARNRQPVIANAAFAGSGAFERIALIGIGDDRKHIRLRCEISGSDLTGVKITKSMGTGGQHSSYFTDDGLSTPMNALPWRNLTSTEPHLTAAGNNPDQNAFELMLYVEGLAEIGIEVKSSGAGSVKLMIG